MIEREKFRVDVADGGWSPKYFSGKRLGGDHPSLSGESLGYASHRQA
jgi:hypothetical protein